MSSQTSKNTGHLSNDEVKNLADFILFSQRNCILRLSPELNKGKISYPQFFLLTYLAEEECLSMSNIAKMMGHSTAAATGMVDKLQDLGYLNRCTAAADRRKIMVRITQQGLDLVAKMRSNIANDLAQIMAKEPVGGQLEKVSRVVSRRSTRSTASV